MKEVHRRATVEMERPRLRMKRTSSMILSRKFESETEETKYGKWWLRLQVSPESNVIRGSKIPLKGIVSGNLVMYRK